MTYKSITISQLADNLRKIRKIRKLRQSDVANKVGLSREFYNRLESGKYTINHRTLEDIMSELNCTMEIVITVHSDDSL